MTRKRLAIIGNGMATSRLLDELFRHDAVYDIAVFVFRTIEDCRRMRAVARPAASAVVVGGGLLGLEAAKALSDLGLHVTVLHMFDTLMNLQVDRTGGELLRAAVERLGIYVRTGAAATALLGNGHVEAVKLDGG